MCLWIDSCESLAWAAGGGGVDSSAVGQREVDTGSAKSARALKCYDCREMDGAPTESATTCLFFLSRLPPLSPPLWVSSSSQSPSTLQINLPRAGRAWSGSLPVSNIFSAFIRKDACKKEASRSIIKQGWIPWYVHCGPWPFRFGGAEGPADVLGGLSEYRAPGLVYEPLSLATWIP